MKKNSKNETGISAIKCNEFTYGEIFNLFGGNSITNPCQWVVKSTLSINDALGLIRSNSNMNGGVLTVIGSHRKKHLNAIHKRLLDIQASGTMFNNVQIYQPCGDKRVRWVLPIVELNTDSSMLNLNNTDTLSIYRIGFNPNYSSFIVDDYYNMKFWGHYYLEDSWFKYKVMFQDDYDLYEYVEHLLLLPEYQSSEKEGIVQNKSLKLPIDSTNFEEWLKVYNNRFCLIKVALKEVFENKPIQRKLL